MKKENLKQSMLLIFAILAVYAVFMPNAVAVYSLEQNSQPYYCSYFTLVEGVTGNICPPLAAVCACVVLTLTGIFMVRKNAKLLPAVKLLSLAGSVLAVVPILVKDAAVQVVPNVLVPIALLAEYAVAYYLEKQKLTADVKPTGKRLK